MKKRILSLTLVLSMLCAFMPIVATAATSGTCGANLTWTLDDEGTLTISGTGDMNDYYYAYYVPWHDNRSTITSVVIGNGVTSISSYAFYECRSLTDVYISDLAAWCNIAFSGSYSNPLSYANNLYLNNVLITELAIPDSVTRIGDYAFDGCKSLTSITIPNSVTSIGEWTFFGCTEIYNVKGEFDKPIIFT